MLIVGCSKFLNTRVGRKTNPVIQDKDLFTYFKFNTMIFNFQVTFEISITSLNVN